MITKESSLHRCVLSLLLAGAAVSSGFAQTSLFDPTLNVGDGTDGHVNAIVVQGDQAIIGGSFDRIGFVERRRLARLNQDGSIDDTFPAGTDDSISQMAVDGEGRILVSGSFSTLQGESRSRLGRLLPTGAVDPDFNSGDFFNEGLAPFAIAAQPDGKVLVATFEDQSSRLFRLLPGGGLDPDFVQTNFFSGWHIVRLAVRADGTILAGGGFHTVNGRPLTGLAVLSSAGELDASRNFGLDFGTTVFSFLTNTDNSTLIGGVLMFTNRPSTKFVARLTPSLEWDTNFITAEFRDTKPGFAVRDLVRGADGRLVAVGNFHNVGGYLRNGIVRFRTDGQVDGCFDPGLGLRGGFGLGGAIAAAPLADGRIWVGGAFGLIDGRVQWNLARLLSGNECDVSRTYMIGPDEEGGFDVIGTFPPAGTNFLQYSTNMIDWIDIVEGTDPQLNAWGGDTHSLGAAGFFRTRKVR